MDRKDNESYISYIKRLISAKENGKIDYNEFGDYLLGDENTYSVDNIRKSFYTLKKVFNKINEDVSVTEDEVLNEIKIEKLELEKMKIQFQDQKREYRAYLRQDARFEHLLGVVKVSILELNREPYMEDYIDLGEEKYTCASLLLGDFHVGMEIEDELNTYNIEVFKDRMKELRDKTIKYCKKHNVYQLNVELLGDLINGYLRVSSRIKNEEDVITQTMVCSEMLSEFVNDLASYIPEINIFSCVGNHSRTTPNLSDSLQIENFERIITWYLQTRIQCKNVSVKDCDVDLIRYTNMNGKRIYCVHGNLDKPNQVVNNMSQMYKEFPDEIHLSHFHSYKETDEYDVGVLVNGTMGGTDSYAKSIRKSCKPCQVLRVYDEDVCTYKIKL